VISKEILRRHVIGVLPRHGGVAGRDTSWLSLVPENPPEWLRPLGGRLGDALAILRKAARPVARK
jgi:hypothetical protein